MFSSKENKWYLCLLANVSLGNPRNFVCLSMDIFTILIIYDALSFIIFCNSCYLVISLRFYLFIVIFFFWIITFILSKVYFCYFYPTINSKIGRNHHADHDSLNYLIYKISILSLLKLLLFLYICGATHRPTGYLH